MVCLGLILVVCVCVCVYVYEGVRGVWRGRVLCYLAAGPHLRYCLG